MLPQDYDLKTSEIQQIAGEDAVAGLFTALGYDTAHCLKQTPEAMGFPEALAREVNLIERIADHEQGALQVYLVEMKHVTVVLTQALARVFKNRAGLYLLILTTPDYERMDFVLLDPLPPESGKSVSGIGSAQAVLRPRILTVERRNPDRVSLRVLRRFSFTEMDADYQWEKLRSAYGVAEWSEPLFNNRALFSDYYLNERLPDRDEWKEDSKSAYRAFCSLLVGVREKYSGKSEEIIRAEFLEPAFKALGWITEPGKDPKDEGNKPDYYLKTQTGEKIPCLAYAWDRALDGPDEQRDTGTPHENPAQSVVSILEELNPDETGWAIMTNGKTWRLYCARAHSRATNYFEIDLEETLASPDLADAFRYYWLLFRGKAFFGQPTFVDSILTESESYAKALGERLKDRVFEHVFPRFAEGFVEQQGKPAVKLTENELTETYHATLTFLYRILFLLYAESRDLLPVRETRGYWEISLKKMKEEISAKAGTIEDQAPERLKKAYSPTSTELYDRLSELFRVIDKGKAELNVPMYNGGLFVTDAANANDESDETSAIHFLTTHKIPDRFLAMGLDLLARDIDVKTESLAMIDYKSLGVRQLGSIYEGLLEFKLRVAQEKMAVVAGKKNEEVVPYTEAMKEERRIKTRGKGAEKTEQIYHKGDPYLENDNHERKVSGSYYTPDYIVKYIVQNTVGPALESKCEVLRPRLREAQKAYHAAVERQKAFQKIGQKGDDPEKVANTFRSVVDELFDLRVLDPAMGSGHFLVEAVDVITDRMLAFLNAFPWNPVTAALRQTRLTILEEMQRQSVNVDPARLTDVNLLKRHVLKRCIYGVDLNPMAVELAKVSLWLDCFTLGAPLSFLDHHLKCGNSLIGARVEEVRKATETAQLSLFGGSLWASAMLATDMMIRVGMLSDVTAVQVRESRDAFLQANDALFPYKRILDVFTSRWFGNEVVKKKGALTDVDRALDILRSPEGEKVLFRKKVSLNPEQQKVLGTALKAAREKRFFHWELEFPEVFFGASKASHQQIVMKDNPGFDAVIGNPPYVNANELNKALSEYEKPYWKSRFKSAEGAYDLYLLFIERSLELCKNGFRSALITPNKYLSSPYAVAFRGYFAHATMLLKLLNLSRVQVFDDPAVYPIVTVLQNQSIDKQYTIQIETPDSIENFAKLTVIMQSSENLTKLPENIWGFLISDELPLILKIQGVSDQLQDIAAVNASSTASEADDYEKALTENQSQDTKKFINTGLIDRFETSWGLESLTHKGQVFATPYLDISNRVVSTERVSQYKKPKIIFAKMAQRNEAFLDEHGDFASANTNFVYESTYSLHYLIAVLNSKLSAVLYGGYFGSLIMGGGYYQFQAPQLRVLPIRRIAFSTPTAYRKALANEAQALAFDGNEPSLLGFVMSRMNARPEESDVVHDLLASLAKRMMDLNKQKQAEMKRFVVWLDGLLKISVDDLTGKSKLKNYLGDYQKSEPELTFAELEDILFKNKSKLSISLNNARLIAKMRDEYEKSLTALRPIKSALVWTDNMIDQIVYRLYGLTDEEIKLVEGK